MQVIADPQVLEQMLEQAARKAIEQYQADHAQVGDFIARPEAKAASLIGMRSHQLRDARLRGEISFSKGPGGKIFYTKQDLLDFLQRSRTEARV